METKQYVSTHQKQHTISRTMVIALANDHDSFVSRYCIQHMHACTVNCAIQHEPLTIGFYELYVYRLIHVIKPRYGSS